MEKLVAAAEEERFRRIKHWAGLPTQAIDYCLREGGISLGDVEHIAINRKPGVNNWRRLAFVLTSSARSEIDVAKNPQHPQRYRRQGELWSRLTVISLSAQVHHVEHHLAHLASAFFVSRFR